MVEDVGKATRAEWHQQTMEFLKEIADHVPTWVASEGFYLSSAAAKAIEWAVGFLDSFTRVVNLHPNQALYPGFTDAHAHVIENGYMLELPLVETQSLEEVVKALEEYIHSHPDLKRDKDRWIEGMGWDQTKWNGGEGAAFPTAVSGRRPCWKPG